MNPTPIPRRDVRIDILRAVGLAMIILAHVNPPAVLFHLRNFDVPLMVLLSGMSFGLSYKETPYGIYLWKRAKRLVFPVWFFLSLYWVAEQLIPVENPWLTGDLLGRYLFISGDYLWIIRVFLLVALVSPAIHRFNLDTGQHSRFFVILAVSALSWEVLRFFSLPFILDGPGQSISLFSHFLLPYGLLFALGLRLNTMRPGQYWGTAAAGFVLFALGSGLLYLGGEGWRPTQFFKYPPSFYYFSYALIISSVLLAGGDKIEALLKSLRLLPTALFVGRNSIWIYLWHIPLVEHIHTNFVFKYLFVFAGAALLTYIQTWAVDRIGASLGPATRKNLRTLLTG